MLKFLFGIIFITALAALGWKFVPAYLSERTAELFGIAPVAENREGKENSPQDAVSKENNTPRKEIITRELKRDIKELKRRFLKEGDEDAPPQAISGAISILPAEIQDAAKVPTQALIRAAGTLLEELEKEESGSELAKNTAGKILSAVLPSGLLCPNASR